MPRETPAPMPLKPPSQEPLFLIDGCLDSHTLFAARRQIIIHHKNEEYRLSQTASGKLILTK